MKGGVYRMLTLEPIDPLVHKTEAALAPITSASCSKDKSSLTAIPPTSVVGCTRPSACWMTCVNSCPNSCCPADVSGLNCPGAKWISVPYVYAKAPTSGAFDESGCTRTEEKSVPKEDSMPWIT